jgi:hypothetical protein
MEYTLSWTIDVDADSPEEAARKALAIHRDPDSWATHFDVRDDTGQVCEVDLGVLPHPSACHTIYVLVPMEEGIVQGVEAFKMPGASAEAEARWLLAKGISDEKERERHADWGTGVAVWECDLKP